MRLRLQYTLQIRPYVSPESIKCVNIVATLVHIHCAKNVDAVAVVRDLCEHAFR